MSRGRRLLLLRHGRTGWNAQSRFQGQIDIELDDVGRAQAARAAELLARLRPDALVSSDLGRAAATAAAVAERTGLPVQHDQRLRETYAGAWQGMTIAEIDARFGDERARWRAGEDVSPGGDGERRSEVGARVAGAGSGHAQPRPGGLLRERGTDGWVLEEHNAGSLPQDVVGDES
jgi:probable phosphoglycerate mutase